VLALIFVGFVVVTELWGSSRNFGFCQIYLLAGRLLYCKSPAALMSMSATD